MSSDGSNSSRKENVPPELMICIDMNTGGEDSAGSDHRTYRYVIGLVKCPFFAIPGCPRANLFIFYHKLKNL